MRTFLARSWCCTGAEDKPLDINKKPAGTWRIFSLRELHAATNNFNYDNKLGEGSFGSVYWGQLASGDQIAVKRLKIWSTKAEMEFAVEVEILGRVRHKNLLSLRGYCAEGQERVIVYDYMPKLSLLSHLHGQFAADATLDWQRRMKIAIGTAEGLAYLHHFATPHILHRDIKASNVLLDDAFEAQVADFGLAKLIPDGATPKGKGAIAGYLAPESEVMGSCAKVAAESCDVYSFGVLLLEIVSGRKPIERVTLEGANISKRFIMEWACPLLSEGKYHDIVDPNLQGAFCYDEVTRLVQVASICAQSAPEARPTMLDVVEMLKEPSKISPTKAFVEEDKTQQPSEPLKHHDGSELKST